MSEIALVSSKKPRLKQKADAGSKGAKIAVKLSEEPEKFLSTVQIGITLVGIIAGAYGGEAFTEDLKPFFEKIDWLKNYAEEVAFISIITIITYFSLIIGELVPKSIAMNNPEGITIAMAPIMKVLSILTFPFVILLSFSTKVLLKILMIKEKGESPVTEAELKYMIESGSQHGVIEKQEEEMMYGVFRFGDKRASHLMTRRSDMIWININNSKKTILETVSQTNHTKFPVCDGKLDEVLGIVSVKDILLLADKEEAFDLKKIISEPAIIPSTMPGLKVLEIFQKERIHIGLVVDEFGSIAGIITLHDLVENIIGEFPDDESDESRIIKRDENSWLADAEIEIHRIKMAIGILKFPDEQNYSTLAGFVIHQLHRIPKTGDKFTFNNFEFEIIDMDGNRIDKLLITKIR